MKRSYDTFIEQSHTHTSIGQTEEELLQEGHLINSFIKTNIYKPKGKQAKQICKTVLHFFGWSKGVQKALQCSGCDVQQHTVTVTCFPPR